MTRLLKFFRNVGTGVLISVGMLFSTVVVLVIIASVGKWIEWGVCEHTHDHGCKVIVVEEAHL